MALTWNLAQLVSRFREDTGRSDTGDISDTDVQDLLNDYYVNMFPSDAEVDEFNIFFTQALSATDDGVYAIAQSVDRLDDPVTINGNQITLYRDRELFFGEDRRHGHDHHFRGTNITLNTSLFHKFEDEQFITDPTLVIGTDTTKVKHSAFDYRINDFSFSKATSEVALTGSAIPEDKYGAWSLKVDEDGTITVAAATTNATGFASPRLALEGLDSSDSASAYMGYVTVMKSDGAFTPATTALDASNVTATFTDGKFENRTTPISALLYGQDLYVHPKPNDIYEFKALQIADRPTALTGTDVIADPKHGPAIARGTAILFLEPRGGQDRIADLAVTTRHIFNSIRSDKIKRLLGQEIQRNF